MTKILDSNIFAELRRLHALKGEQMRLEVHDAAVDQEATMRYLRGQSAAYRAFNVEDAQLPNWVSFPPGVVSLVTVSNSKGEMLAGVRMHTRRGSWRLPVEERISHPELDRVLEQADGLAVELCGGWVARSHSKTGLSEFMFLGAVALASVRKAQVVCGCAHTAAMPLYERYGMGFDRSQLFPYPNERYQTYAGVVDLEFAAGAQHPARLAYAELMIAISQGEAYEFCPASALDWDCPRAPELDWDQVLDRRPYSSMSPGAQPAIQASA